MKTKTKNTNNKKVRCYLPFSKNVEHPLVREQIPFEIMSYNKDALQIKNYLDDIRWAIEDKKNAFAIININEDRSPRYISAKQISDLFQGTAHDREVRVEKVKDVKEAKDILDRVGVLITYPFLISAGITEDETAEMMFNICNTIIENNLCSKNDFEI